MFNEQYLAVNVLIEKFYTYYKKYIKFTAKWIYPFKIFSMSIYKPDKKKHTRAQFINKKSACYREVNLTNSTK